jgi:15-cis-phytoene synthase
VLELADSYAACRRVHREHGRSYYLATRLLPAAKRPHVHALYAFTRWADEIVDAAEVTEREQRLEEWGTAFAAALGGGEVTDPLLPAVCHTVRTYDLDLNDVDLFLRSMATDLKVTNYATYDDLLGYMKGSAAAIGTMMLPILGVVPGADRCIAREAAQQLGFAFQLTNFIRDVREDLDRGRIYLPEEDLDRFGVTVDMLHGDAVDERTSKPVRELVGFESRRARAHYAAALPGLHLLEPRSRLCIRAAYLIYREILEEVARNGHDVMRRRAVVSRGRRLALLRYASSSRRFAAYLRGHRP